MEDCGSKLVHAPGVEEGLGCIHLSDTISKSQWGVGCVHSSDTRSKSRALSWLGELRDANGGSGNSDLGKLAFVIFVLSCRTVFVMGYLRLPHGVTRI